MDHAGRVELEPARRAAGSRRRRAGAVRDCAATRPRPSRRRRRPTPCCSARWTAWITGRCRGDVTDGAGLRELGPVLSDTDAGLLTTATALLTWHAAAGFCPRCGEPMLPSPAGWSRVCGRGHEDFPRTDPAVIVLVHDGADAMVLARQPDLAARPDVRARRVRRGR